MSAERTVRVVITGRVQGVGYRAWTEDEAVARGLDGWVRNRSDGAVEALFSGAAEDVAGMLAACREGPDASIVSNVAVTDSTEPAGRSFRVLPTA
jgi:acylphosphatase